MCNKFVWLNKYCYTVMRSLLSITIFVIKKLSFVQVKTTVEPQLLSGLVGTGRNSPDN